MAQYITNQEIPGGNMTGPGSSVNNQVALFNGTTGDLLKAASQSGLPSLASGVLSVLPLPVAGTAVTNSPTVTTDSVLTSFGTTLAASTTPSISYVARVRCQIPIQAASGKDYIIQISQTGAGSLGTTYGNQGTYVSPGANDITPIHLEWIVTLTAGQAYTFEVQVNNQVAGSTTTLRADLLSGGVKLVIEPL